MHISELNVPDALATVSGSLRILLEELEDGATVLQFYSDDR